MLDRFVYPQGKYIEHGALEDSLQLSSNLQGSDRLRNASASLGIISLIASMFAAHFADDLKEALAVSIPFTMVCVWSAWILEEARDRAKTAIEIIIAEGFDVKKGLFTRTLDDGIIDADYRVVSTDSRDSDTKKLR